MTTAFSVANVQAWIGVLATIALIGTLVLIGYRTKSRHLLFRRLWDLVFGAKDIEDEKIKRFLDDRSSVMKLRFSENLHVRTVRQSHRLIDWLEGKDLEPEAVANCGFLFDYEKLALAQPLPSMGRKFALIAFAFCCLVPAALLGSFVASGTVLVELKATKRSIFLSPASARPAWSIRTGTLTLDRCMAAGEEKFSATIFQPNETEIVCGLLIRDASGIQAFIDRSLLPQRSFAGVVLGCLLVYILACIAVGRNIRAAESLRQRLDKKESAAL